MVVVNFKSLTGCKVTQDLPDDMTVAQLLKHAVTSVPGISVVKKISHNTFVIDGRNVYEYGFGTRIAQLPTLGDTEEVHIHCLSNLRGNHYSIATAKSVKNELLENLVEAHLNDKPVSEIEELENSAAEIDGYMSELQQMYNRCKDVLYKDPKFKDYYTVWEQEPDEYYGFETFDDLVNYVRATRFRNPRTNCMEIPNPETGKPIPEPWGGDFLWMAQGPTHAEFKATMRARG